MKKLSTTLPKNYFWITMAAFSVIGLSLIFVNYNTALINIASAEEAHSIFNVNLVKSNSTRNIINCDCEKMFNKEYPVSWTGKVIANFASGEDFAVERYSKYTKYDKFYVDANGMFKGEPGTDVQVIGKLVGVTCAYANSIFGECVGEVVAEKVTVLD